MRNIRNVFLCFTVLFFVNSVSAQEFFLKKWLTDEDYRFPHHYSELIGSWDSHEDALFLGANYTYIPSKMGFYGSFMIGINGSYFANVGPVIRLTDSYNTGVDIHLFQGVGISDGVIEGESGVRFGFGRDWKYGRWSISGSMNYTKNGIGWSAGLSWPLAGITAASGAIIGVAVVKALYVPDAPSSSIYSSSDNSSSSNNNTTTPSSGGKSCDQYQREYNDQLSVVMRNYDTYADSKKYGTNTGQATFRKNLVSSQGRLKSIRREAGAHGCTISASPYEYKMP